MTAAVIAAPAAVLHTSSGHLTKLFNAVAVHTADPTSEDFVLPAFTQVHVEVRDGDLRLACSDRFTMGIVRQPMNSTSADFATSFAVPVEDVRTALESMDGHRVSLIVEQNSLRITTSPGVLFGVPSDLPWRTVLGNELAPKTKPTGHIAFDPKLIARFQAARPLDPQQPLLMRLAGERGAVIATLGTGFLGLIMPVNVQSVARFRIIPDRPLDAWFDLLDESPVEPLPAKAGA